MKKTTFMILLMLALALSFSVVGCMGDDSGDDTADGDDPDGDDPDGDDPDGDDPDGDDPDGDEDPATGDCTEANATMCEGENVMVCEGGSWVEYDCQAICGDVASLGCGETEQNGAMIDWCICDEPVDPCEGVDCGANASCDNGECVCDAGYVMEGDACVEDDTPDPCEGVTCGANAHCQDGACICDAGCTGDPNTGCTCGGQTGGLCPAGETCEEIFESGGMACVIIQEGQLYIPEDAEQNCHMNDGQCSQTNSMCVYLDEAGTQSACIEVCGECPEGLECYDITQAGNYACVDPNTEDGMPADAPMGCAEPEDNPAGCPQGNYSCWLLSDPETGEQTDSICLGNCSAPH